ncbi:MAG: phage Gp37/Gp68 family protein [Chitinivibrionia bacterium]|nr:phage Gp37/Gp68 family protein [Chitinivibrionia bacterium]
MNKSKIEWCDYTWNPITGCLHGCPYCYARGITRRFGVKERDDKNCHCLDYPETASSFRGSVNVPYPYGFSPTFHRYRLDEPQAVRKPQNIFVCSMADLFGDWVPDEWIEEVFAACAKAPQHRYLFLTKNPRRYEALNYAGILPKEHWYGTSLNKRDDDIFCSDEYNTFLSIEPIQERLGIDTQIKNNWVIVGAETGNRKNKVEVKREWLEDIKEACAKDKVPLFMKNSLKPIWGDELIQQFPWEV